MNKLNCLVIDDEPMACKGLVEYIAEIDSLNFIAVVENPTEAIKYLENIDLIYLDINMPKISGIDFLKQLNNPPLTIITTAYPQYALQGFELDVVDYLLKPISFPRFVKASTKAIDYYNLLIKDRSIENKVDDYFFVKSNGILEKIVLEEIIAIEALANYITIHCKEKKIVAYLTLKQINEFLPTTTFIKVHKSFIIALNKIDKIDHDQIILQNLSIPIGSNFKSLVEQQVINGKILKR